MGIFYFRLEFEESIIQEYEEEDWKRREEELLN